MTLLELLKNLGANDYGIDHLALNIALDAPLMVLTEGSEIMSVREVVEETHHDADGSTTIWLKVEDI